MIPSSLKFTIQIGMLKEKKKKKTKMRMMLKSRKSLLNQVFLDMVNKRFQVLIGCLNRKNNNELLIKFLKIKNNHTRR